MEFSRSMPHNKLILLIIDPQNDFHPGGSLGIAGANDDSARIAAFIDRHISAIDEIYVTLDSHHVSTVPAVRRHSLLFPMLSFVLLCYAVYLHYICITLSITHIFILNIINELI
jgi:hypothetical protein